MGKINPLLESALDIAHFVAECAPHSMTIGVSDTTSYLIYYPTHEIDFKLKPGDPIRPNSMADRVEKAQQKRCLQSARHLYNYYGVAI